MLVLYGVIWLQIKVDGEFVVWVCGFGMVVGFVVLVLFVIGGFWVSQMDGYCVVFDFDLLGFSNLLCKEVVIEVGFWLYNYGCYLLLLLVLVFGFFGVVMVLVGLVWCWGVFSFIGFKLLVVVIIIIVGVFMFLMILFSSSQFGYSLIVWDGFFSEYILVVMLFVIVVLLFLVFFYIVWVYKVLWGWVIEDDVNEDMY